MISLKAICVMAIFQYRAYFKYKAHLCILYLMMSVISLVEGVNPTTVFEVVCAHGPV